MKSTIGKGPNGRGLPSGLSGILAVCPSNSIAFIALHIRAMADVQQAQHQEQQQPDGFFSSTAGTYFADKEALQEHYRSDFHRYNLKRKVAGLPPVTREWFDARKEQLNLAAGGNVSRVRVRAYTHGVGRCGTS